MRAEKKSAVHHRALELITQCMLLDGFAQSDFTQVGFGKLIVADPQTAFTPLRVVMSSGESYVIRHPEMAVVTEDFLEILSEVKDVENEVPRHIAWCGWINLAHVEPLRNGAEKGKKKRAQGKDADTRALEQSLSTQLGLTVTIVHKGDKGGEIRVAYKTLEQLDDVCRKLGSTT